MLLKLNQRSLLVPEIINYNFIYKLSMYVRLSYHIMTKYTGDIAIIFELSLELSLNLAPS